MLRHNLSVAGPVRIDKRVDDKDNSWNTPGVTVTDKDVESVDPAAMTGPRNPDGSLPASGFLRPKASGNVANFGAFPRE